MVCLSGYVLIFLSKKMSAKNTFIPVFSQRVVGEFIEFNDKNIAVKRIWSKILFCWRPVCQTMELSVLAVFL